MEGGQSVSYHVSDRAEGLGLGQRGGEAVPTRCSMRGAGLEQVSQNPTSLFGTQSQSLRPHGTSCTAHRKCQPQPPSATLVAQLLSFWIGFKH